MHNVRDSNDTRQPQNSALHFLPCNMNNQTKKSGRDERRASKAFVVTGHLQIYNNCFYLDQLGEPLLHDEALECYIPFYQRGKPDTLDGEVDLPTDEDKVKLNRRSCFNCGMKDHQLKDCPSPRNFQLISQRRQQFLDQASNTPPSGNVRYHADNEVEAADQRFLKFKPGVISEDLRKALGIGKRELPPYIYQMRWHGYPPGHLKEARIQGSGLNFYDKNNSSNEEIDLKEGPLDVDKIIDYPGFNVTPGRHARDNSHEVGAPPMDERHSKDVMVSYHKHRNQLLKRKMDRETENVRSGKKNKPNTDTVVRNDDIREVDMDTGDDGTPDESLQHAMTDDANSQEETNVANGEESTEYFEETVEERASAEVEDGELYEAGEGMETLDEVEDISEVVDQDEEENCLDGIDIGDLDEEELQIKKELILRRLMNQTPGEDSICVPETNKEVIDLTSDVEETIQDEVIILEDNENSIDDVEEVKIVPSYNDNFKEDSIEYSQEFFMHSHSDSIAQDSNTRNLPSFGSATTNLTENSSDSKTTTELSQQPSTDSKLAKMSKCKGHIVESDSPESPPTEAVEATEEKDQSHAEYTTELNETAVASEQSSPGSLTVNAVTINPEEQDNEVESTPKDGVPHRSKFAQGITQFDAYYGETKSQGVYTKLRTLLKSSPRRQQDKDS
ncbi:unnamed protein product [Clavelina lepadiformis]|uniref:Zinc finger CCHC domain-containing protein 8 n=1 Tax=Clavelina lepadiformis TaxID=159417 RepID=A0ABP0FL62_CLALP